MKKLLYIFALLFFTHSVTAQTTVVADNLNASFENNQARIDWTIFNETNVDSYILEKSNDGFKFTTLRTIASNATSTVSKNSFIDISLFNGNNFYRVKSVEKSGNYTYSNIAKLFVGKLPSISINPTIVNTGNFNLQMNNVPKGQYQMLVLSNAGVPLISKLINTEVEGPMSQTINLPAGTARGLYIVRFYGNELNLNQKIVVQ